MAEGSSLAEDRNRGAELLEGLLAGRLSPEDALEQWPEPINSRARTLTDAWTNLQHFGDDQDLFAKDAEYAASCRERLGKLAAKLRVEAVELGNEPSKGWDSPSTNNRLARMIFSAFGYAVGYVPLMGFLMPLGDIGMADLIQFIGLVGLSWFRHSCGLHCLGMVLHQASLSSTVAPVVIGNSASTSPHGHEIPQA